MKIKSKKLILIGIVGRRNVALGRGVKFVLSVQVEVDRLLLLLLLLLQRRRRQGGG
jgi:hypothetical protein